MSDDKSNGIYIESNHHIVDSLNGVIQYDRSDSESGSGKMGTLCLCQFGISMVLPGELNDCGLCLHENCGASLFTPLPIIKNVFLFVDAKLVDLSDFDVFDDVQSDKLVLHCKDFQEITLHLPKKDESLPSFLKCLWQKLFKNIEQPINEIYVSPDKNCVSSFLDFTSWEKELRRLNINSRKPKWKIIENKSFEICDVICRYAVVPSSISLESVSDSGTNHYNHRFMTWCWTDSDTMVSLLRCSEPKTILNNSYLSKIMSTVNSGKARTHAVLSTARLKDSCPSEETISSSFEKLWNTCLVKDCDNFYKNLDSCKWLHHMQSLIRASRHIARTLKCDKNPVVVMDQSGRDISCVIVSLVVILCDKYYRTIDGFANLINKEWVAAGYSFYSSLMTINGHKNFLPTFMMFLDCVHNIILQYPTEFEFTDHYLIEILDTIFSGDSKLFMFNCPKDLSLIFKDGENGIVNQFWMNVFKNRSNFSNPLFDLKDRIFKPKQNSLTFDKESHHARTNSYLYAVSKGFDGINDSKSNSKRRSILMFQAFKKSSLHLFPKGRKKSKAKKDRSNKVGASSFFSETESSRERLTSIKNIFKSKFDPININYSLINMNLWYRYYFRHAKTMNYDENDILLQSFVQDITVSCSDLVISHTSDDLSEQEDSSTLASLTKSSNNESHSCSYSIERSDSCTTIASDPMERSIHVSEIDLFNDHLDKDYESAEELSLNGLDSYLESPSGQFSDSDKQLSYVVEDFEMSNTKSTLTVQLEIAEATNDVQDF